MTQCVKYGCGSPTKPSVSGVYSLDVDASPIDLRERTRSAVRSQLAETALRLFIDQGFEATTVDQIAAATGLSRRSFHRYFASKEDVLGQWFVMMGGQIADALSAQPPGEAAWDALRRSFDGLVAGLSAQPEALAITRMMLSSPALRGSHLQKHADWREVLAAVLQQRAGENSSRSSRLTAMALAGAALACLDSAQTEWVAQDNSRSLADLLDEAMRAVAPLRV